MLLMVDQAIPGARDLFGLLGEVRTFDGRALTEEQVADADALIVRSVTPIGPALLERSRVRFVGTVTSGTDHVDEEWLSDRGHTFASAGGCNARPVAEYVMTALFVLADRYRWDPRSKTLGVLGVGHVGGLVASWAERLGMEVLTCDPPLQEAGVPGAWVSPEALRARSDIVTLHVPLSREGSHRTSDMVDAQWLSDLCDGAILVNTARGEVIVDSDLVHEIDGGRIAHYVCDVWRNEPRIPLEALSLARIATPHVAGYSVESRWRGVAMVFRQLAEWASATHGIETAVDRFLTVEPGKTLTLHPTTGTGADFAARMAAAMHQMCPISEVDGRLRPSALGGDPSRDFDALRAEFSKRREFSGWRLSRSDASGLGALLELGVTPDPA